jgi:hypothetical protein
MVAVTHEGYEMFDTLCTGATRAFHPKERSKYLYLLSTGRSVSPQVHLHKFLDLACADRCELTTIILILYFLAISKLVCVVYPSSCDIQARVISKLV